MRTAGLGWVGILCALAVSCSSPAGRDDRNVAPSQHRLTLRIAGPAQGSVSTGSAAPCHDVCESQLPDGTRLSLTATPDIRSGFSGWSGACSGLGTCELTVDRDVEVTATFERGPVPPDSVPPGSHTVTVSTVGSGSILSKPPGMDCGAACSASFPDGTSI